jgi:hypothetical protein
MKSAAGILLAAVFVFICSSPTPAQTVLQGAIPHEDDLGAVRYRSFGNTGGDEIYLGIPDLGVAANRTAKDFGSQRWGAENEITFRYDPIEDELHTIVRTGPTTTFTLTYPNFSTQLPLKGKTFGPDRLNLMQISVVCRDPDSQTSSVSLNDVSLDGHPLGSFTASGWSDWTVVGYDFSQGFVLTGRLVLSGPFSTSQELSKVEIKVGVLLCQDLDGDGWGNPASQDCPQPQLDCDDSNPAVNPAAAEVCDNGIDDDCDGFVDGDDPDCASAPGWAVGGTEAEASISGQASARSPESYNFAIAFLFAPGVAILVLRRLSAKKASSRISRIF